MEATDVLASAEQAALDSVQAASNRNRARSITASGGSSSTATRSNGTAKHDHVDDDEEEGAYVSPIEADAAEMSFIIDTAGNMDVDREIALGDDEAQAERTETHVEAGLLLPTHVNVVPTQPTHTTSNPTPTVISISDDNESLGEMGEFEQLDLDPSIANRYYGAEEKAERRAKEVCLACGEQGHDRRHCPHQHCLACGAMDDHPTRFCPMSTSCFRCGQMGHQTRTCPKPRRAGRSDECERCGSMSHVKALCPTLWRVYSYGSAERVERWRAKMFSRLSKAGGERGMEPDGDEVSDSEDEFVAAGEPGLPMGQADEFDPATRWCYNCSSAGNHWGDDCPEPR